MKRSAQETGLDPNNQAIEGGIRASCASASLLEKCLDQVDDIVRSVHQGQ